MVHNIENLPEGELINRQRAAERALLQMGITFNVYGERAGVEKIFPFDLAPRIVPAAEWSRIERGLKQRIRALNLFVDDLYHGQNRRIDDDFLDPQCFRADSMLGVPGLMEVYQKGNVALANAPGGGVALKKGSLVVNSSQGGGSKDTWVLADAPGPDKDELGSGSPSSTTIAA